MPSYYYEKLVKDADDLMDQDVLSDRVDPHKALALTFKAKPKKNVSTEFGWTDQQEWKDDTLSESRKTEGKVSIDHGDCKTSWTFANDKFAFKAEADALKGDWHVDTTGGAEVKPAKGEWKVNLGTHGYSPDFSGIKLYWKAIGEYNQKGETTLKKGFNFAYQGEYHAGMYLETDLAAAKKLWAQLVATPDKDSAYWLRSDLNAKLVSAGCTQKIKDHIKHAFEVSYDMADGAKGFQGFPVTLKGGVEYDLSESTEIEASASVSDHYEVNFQQEHEIDRHWEVEAHQHFNSSKIGTKQGPYALGFKVQYRL